VTCGECGEYDSLREETLDPASAPAPSSISRLRALHEIGRRLLAQRKPEEVLGAIQDAILEYLKPDHACILLVSSDGSLRAVAQNNLDLKGSPSDWSVSHTALQRTLGSGLSLLTLDAPMDPLFGESASVRRLGIRTILCVPLGVRPVRGLIYIDRRFQDTPFSRDDLEFLTAVSVHATLVLERAEQHIRTVEELEQSDERLRFLQDELLRHKIVGQSPKLLAAYDALRRFARNGARVLLRGETGTGKELFARAYAAECPRRGGPFIPVPIPALAPTLIESELFGHIRGAFTEAARERKGRLELADHGILFLDEVGDVDLALQPKLLRFLDSGEIHRVGDNTPRRVDALVISATNRPLERLVSEERFRADLFARLGHVLEIPPLRERPEDIPLLTEHFLDMYDRGEPHHVASPETIEVLRAYSWEFNIRELQQVIERAVCLGAGAIIRPDDLPPHIVQKVKEKRSLSEAPRRTEGGRPLPLRDVVEAAEQRHILGVLEYTGGNRRKAIEILGIATETFYKRLEDLGIRQKRQ
jgi:transcriptional regulator with GAF, ATPase, and Fis domain